MVLLRKHYDEMRRMAGDKTFGDWDIPLFKADIAQADIVSAFFQRTEIDGLHCIYDEDAVTTAAELKDAFEEVNGRATFKKIQNKLPRAIAATSEALDDGEEFIYEPTPEGNVYEYVCKNFLCGAIIQDGVQCCDSYGDGPKTDRNKATKRRVTMKVKNLRIVRCQNTDISGLAQTGLFALLDRSRYDVYTDTDRPYALHACCVKGAQ
eukprot:COSAG02_NODE_290_length_25531_cov_75.132392_21_plen_208_part_00